MTLTYTVRARACQERDPESRFAKGNSYVNQETEATKAYRRRWRRHRRRRRMLVRTPHTPCVLSKATCGRAGLGWGPWVWATWRVRPQ